MGAYDSVTADSESRASLFDLLESSRKGEGRNQRRANRFFSAQRFLSPGSRPAKHLASRRTHQFTLAQLRFGRHLLCIGLRKRRSAAGSSAWTYHLGPLARKAISRT